MPNFGHWRLASLHRGAFFIYGRELCPHLLTFDEEEPEYAFTVSFAGGHKHPPIEAMYSASTAKYVSFCSRVEPFMDVFREAHSYGQRRPATAVGHRSRIHLAHCARITASQHRKRLGLGVDPRRFQFEGKKEAAGVCRRCGESMETESEPACNQQFSWINQKPMMRALPAHAASVWHNPASAPPAASS